MKEPIRLRPADAERYVKLRRRMLTESPWAFSSDPEHDHAGDARCVAENLAHEENAIFAIEVDGTLVAAAGVRRGENPKFAHRAGIWGVFVEPDYRGRGYGARLLSEAIELARSWPGVEYVDLGVSAGALAARRLYERLGFVVWGTEPEATQVQGRRYDEHHMTLRLGPRP